MAMYANVGGASKLLSQTAAEMIAVGGGWTKITSQALTGPTDSMSIEVPTGYDVLKYTIFYRAIEKESSGNILFRIDFNNSDGDYIYENFEGINVMRTHPWRNNNFSYSANTTPGSSNYSYIVISLDSNQYGVLTGYLYKTNAKFEFQAGVYEGYTVLACRKYVENDLISSISNFTLYSDYQNLQKDTCYLIEGMKF